MHDIASNAFSARFEVLLFEGQNHEAGFFSTPVARAVMH
jgi:hypothetical protein